MNHLEVLQETILKRLGDIKTQVFDIAEDSRITQRNIHESDLKYRHESTLEIVEALRSLLLQNQNLFEETNADAEGHETFFEVYILNFFIVVVKCKI